MRCPNCKKELLCGCGACIKRTEKQVNDTFDLLVWTENDCQKCNNCGFERFCDFWLDEQKNE